jgi:hypothetical protein
MDLGNGWQIGESQRRQLRVLEWLVDQTGDGPIQPVDPAPLFEEFGAQRVMVALDALERDGLVRADAMGLEEASIPAVEPAGIEMMERIRELRQDNLRRQPAARDALLRWIYDQKYAGNPSPNLGQFSTSSYATFYGSSFIEKDVDTASIWLRDEGYIKGTGSWGGGVVRPMIEPKGERLVEREGSVSDPETPHSVYNTSYVLNSPGAAVAQGNRDVHQSTNVEFSAEQRRQALQIADYLDEVAPQLGFPAAALEEAQAVATQIRDEVAQDQPDAGKIRHLIGSTVFALATQAAAVPLGAGLLALIHQYLGLG